MFGIVLLWMVVYLSGMLLCKIEEEKGTNRLWIHLTGFFFLFICQGTVFFSGQLLGWGFRKSESVLAVSLLVISLLALFFCRKELAAEWKKLRSFRFKEYPYCRHMALLGWLFLALVFAVIFSVEGNRKDAMVETVQTTLLTDTMNEYHPFTGQKLELGVITSRKILTLPFWYASLSRWTGLPAMETVRVLGTLTVLIFTMLAYAELAGLLFFRSFKKTWLLLILIELLWLSGDYCLEAAGYQQLFYGYSGEVMVATVIIPCIFCILYRFFGRFLREDFPAEKEKIGFGGAFISLGLCVAASLFLTSLAWGLLMIATAVLLFLLSMLGVRLTKRIGGKRRLQNERNS